MVWPLKNRLADTYVHWTIGDLKQILADSDAADDDRLWIDNYRQLRSITQRPVELTYVDVDGIHIG